jgi:hypothetical protein
VTHGHTDIHTHSGYHITALFAGERGNTIYEASAHEYHISFNVAKTKCLIVSPNYHRMSLQQADIYQFHIINPPIEFVKSLVHLGHIITSTVTDDEDLIQSENNFITQFNNMASYF